MCLSLNSCALKGSNEGGSKHIYYSLNILKQNQLTIHRIKATVTLIKKNSNKIKCNITQT